MSDQNGASASPLSLFSPERRGELLKQTVGKGTGVLVEIGGLTIDLLPFTTAEGLSLFSVVRKFSAIYRKVGAQTFSEADLIEFIGNDGPEILALLTLYLARCLRLKLEPIAANVARRSLELKEMQIADQPERESFVLWAASIELWGTLKAIGSPLLKANGVLDLIRPQTAAPADVAEKQPSETSTPSTASATS